MHSFQLGRWVRRIDEHAESSCGISRAFIYISHNQITLRALPGCPITRFSQLSPFPASGKGVKHTMNTWLLWTNNRQGRMSDRACPLQLQLGPGRRHLRLHCCSSCNPGRRGNELILLSSLVPSWLKKRLSADSSSGNSQSPGAHADTNQSLVFRRYICARSLGSISKLQATLCWLTLPRKPFSFQKHQWYLLGDLQLFELLGLLY